MRLSALKYIFSKLALLFLLIPLIALPGLSVAEDVKVSDEKVAQLRAENAALQAEIALAKDSGLYIMLDLSSGSALVKSRALALKSFIIHSSSLSGAPPVIKSQLIAERKASRPPKRKQIDPAAKKEMQASGDGTLQSNYEIDALELNDMPTDFELLLEDKSVIRVHSVQRGFVGNIGAAFRGIGDALFDIFGTVPPRRVELELNSQDVQALYWIAAEKVPVILIARINSFEPPATEAGKKKSTSSR